MKVAEEEERGRKEGERWRERWREDMESITGMLELLRRKV